MIAATIFEAKTKLSELVRRACLGETVIITSGRKKAPVARLSGIAPIAKKRLGARANPGFKLTKGFFEPLPEDQLRLWSGEGE